MLAIWSLVPLPLWNSACTCGIKDRNGKDLREAEEIKKRWQEYTKELYKKCLNDPNNNDGVVTHLESDILECESRWVMGSITRNRASGGNGITAESLGLWDIRGRHLTLCIWGNRSPGALLLHILLRVPTFLSSLLGVMSSTSVLTYAMANDRLLFQGLAQIYALTGTHIMAIMASGTLTGE